MIEEAAIAKVGELEAQFHKVLSVRPAHHLVQLKVFLGVHDVLLRATAGECVLHDDLGSVGDADGRVVLPADQELELAQPVGRRRPAVAEDPFALPLIEIGSPLRQHQAAHALICAGVVPLVVLTEDGVLFAELMLDLS